MFYEYGVRDRNTGGGCVLFCISADVMVLGFLVDKKDYEYGCKKRFFV